MQHSDPLWEVPLQVVQEALVINHKDQAGVEGQTGVLEDLVPETVHPATCVDHTAAVPVCVGRGGEGGELMEGEGRGGEEGVFRQHFLPSVVEKCSAQRRSHMLSTVRTSTG